MNTKIVFGLAIGSSVVLAALGVLHSEAKYVIFDKVFASGNMEPSFGDSGDGDAVASLKEDIVALRQANFEVFSHIGIEQGITKKALASVFAEPALTKIWNELLTAYLAADDTSVYKVIIVEWQGVSVSGETAKARWIEHDQAFANGSLKDKLGYDTQWSAELVKKNGEWRFSSLTPRAVTPQFITN